MLVSASEAADHSAKAEQQGHVLEVELEEAAARPPALVNQVQMGEDVVLSDGRRVLGQDAGLFEVPEDFDEPLPDALVDAFGS